jgi:hypothetical protein
LTLLMFGKVLAERCGGKQRVDGWHAPTNLRGERLTQ